MIEQLIKATLFIFLFSCAQVIADDLILVRIETNLGTIEVQLDAKKAPLSSGNFLKHVDAAHYNNMIFHRVIEGFVVQSGGYKENLEEMESEDTLFNEADNGCSGKCADCSTHSLHCYCCCHLPRNGSSAGG